jgi:hypothetical protein
MKCHHFQLCPWKEGVLPPLGQWRNKHYSPESMHEAITVIEIICSKAMMHMDTCLKIFEDTLDIVNECCTFPHLTCCHNSSLEQQCWAIPELVTSGKDCWLSLFGTEHLTDSETQNILKPPQWPHTQIHPQCALVPWTFSILVSVNVWAFI